MSHHTDLATLLSHDVLKDTIIFKAMVKDCTSIIQLTNNSGAGLGSDDKKTASGDNPVEECDVTSTTTVRDSPEISPARTESGYEHESKSQNAQDKTIHPTSNFGHGPPN